MSWRFRRSTKIGPFRLTATKRGFSTSVGVPGARIGINTKGQIRATGGIPGTGVYDTEIIGHVGGAKSAQTRSSHQASDDDNDDPIVQIAPGARNVDAVEIANRPREKSGSSGKTVTIVIMAIVIVVLLLVIASR